MINPKKHTQLPKLLALFLVLTQVTHAEDSELDDLKDTYGNEKMLSIATGHPILQNLSPSVTSVMTSKDIEKIGARRLEDVLEYLPGAHVSSARAGNTNNVIGFRGIYSEANSQVLILINGVPQKNTFIGGKPFAWTMPVKNISHIEVIRGPGSMLYGGDAITGVINIILKTGNDLKGGNVGSFLGSQNTYEGWAQYGQKNNDWEYSFSAQGGTTNGSQGRIERDAQSFLDNQLGTRVSNAPGFTNNGRDDIDARVDVAYKDWLRLRAGYQRFNNVQTGQGAALALDRSGTTNEDVYNLDLSANHKFNDNLTSESKAYFVGQDTRWNWGLLPPGTLGGFLPQGANVQTTHFQGTTGLTTQLNYTGIKAHNVTSGTGIIYNWIDNISDKLNYLITPGFIQQILFTELSSLGSDPNLKSRNRTNFYALLQDEWNFATDFYLTTGLRYDFYSDTTDGFSPRISLVWNVNNNLTTKLLYSRSFRPPSFLEKNLTATPTTILKPEIMDTVEFQVENKWSPQLTTSTNAYWFQLDNLITSANQSILTTVQPFPTAFSNASKINGMGTEVEGRFTYNDNLNMSLNYSYHHVSQSDNTGLLPEHMIKALIDWKFTKDWMIGSQLSWVGERKRPANDPRPNLSNYFIAGVTLSTKVAKPLELTLRVNNVFGANAKEPSVAPTLLPGDLPVNDLSVLGQIKWSF
ncbi:MAG: TonB-dependent receptor [Methylobacter sp.]|nr:TonB-dependent receptor [Methylobacter sp.]